jgi:cytochrome c biogenesis factor
MAVVLIAGELLLIRFHMQLYDLAVVVDPATGGMTGRVAVPLWVESEKLFVWALCLAVLGTLMRRQRSELLTGVMLVTAVLAAGAALVGKPFTEPLGSFFGQYYGYLQATAQGGQAAVGAFTGMESARQFYYNAWYMWVHPPLLFLSYGCFAISFIATLQMIRHKHSSFETTAYRWARLGYLPLTFGMLIGFPWALSAWQGDAWWWSGKVNMSLMMWLLYTAVLHARLYLRRSGMWRTVAALSVLSFAILVMTYVTTYVVPGAHSYALVPDLGGLDVVALLGRGGGPL